MPSTTNTGRTEAFQSLLRSLGHANDDSSSGTASSAEQLQKLSEKISAVLGGGEDRSLLPGDQLLNEDGLPIIDISELVDEGLRTDASPPPAPEQDLVTLSLVSPAEREQRRRERDRILDLLEKEERLQQLQEERDADEERKEEFRKRKESAKAELHQLRAAQELQKKMGQALLQRVKGTQDSGKGYEKAHTMPSITKRSVSFADVPPVHVHERSQRTPNHQPDCGDVSLGRLRAPNRAPLVSTTEAQKDPMKIRIVERRPALEFSPNDADSDDESTSVLCLSPRLEPDSFGQEDESLLSGNTLSDDALLEGFDYDMAQHYREIALEYHEKRHTISAETAKAMAGHISGDDEQVSLQSKGQLPSSHFRADRISAAYDRSHAAVSTSVGQNVIPASRQKSFLRSVRLGKLENDQLFGGEDGESGSEDEAVSEVIQMLRTGNIQNVGPEFNPSSMSTITLPRDLDNVVPHSTGTSTVVRVTKPSNFNAARGKGSMEMTTFEGDIGRDNAQSQPTVLNVFERRTPRMTPRQQFPVNKPLPRSHAQTPESLPPMIIDSPSFPMTPSLESSPAHSVTTGLPSLCQTQLERLPLVDADSSATQNPVIWPRVPKQDSLSMERPISKFMAERKKLTE